MTHTVAHTVAHTIAHAKPGAGSPQLAGLIWARVGVTHMTHTCTCGRMTHMTHGR